MSEFNSGDVVYLIKNGVQTFEQRPYLNTIINASIGTRLIIHRWCSCGCGGYLVEGYEDPIPTHCLTKEYKTPKGNRYK